MENMEDELERLIRATEIVILPEGSSIEEFLTSSTKPETSTFTNNRHGEVNFTSDETNQVDEDLDYEEDIEDFEAAFQSSRTKSHQQFEIPTPQDFSYLLNDLPSVSCSMNMKEQQAEKALVFNEVFREKLISFNLSLQTLLQKVNEKFRINNLYLEAVRNERQDSAHFKKSYVKCGAPFFKDAHGDPAPPNEDYRYRKNVLKEFFPFDQFETRNDWKTSEKVKLIEGVKNQMVSYIVSEQSKKVCQDSRKTRGKTQKLKFITNNKDLQTSSISSIYKTIEEMFPEFAINWNIISFGDLNSEHSVSECMGMWYSYLSPKINREPFTEEETVTIVNAVTDDNYETWQDVANLLNNRSVLQTYLLYTSIYMKLCPPKVRWTPEEDQLLIDSIAKYSVGPNSTINWSKIGQDFPLRSKTQCYNRYVIIMKNRNSKRGTFSEDEDKIILNFVIKHGEKNINKFPISSLPGRSITQIRNHYNMSLKVNGTFQPWTREEDKQLMEFVEKNGCDFSKLASIMKTHSRISCRTRHQTILKFLSKNPQKTLSDVPLRNKPQSSKKMCLLTQDESTNDRFSIIEISEEKEKESVLDRNMEKMKRENFDLYCMFLPCFNLDFGQPNLEVDDNDALVLMKMLHVSPRELHIPKNVTSFTSSQIEIIERLKKTNESPLGKIDISGPNLMIPPSLTTAAGLRAIYVKTKDCRKTMTDFNLGNSEQFKNSLKEFQERFIALFYWTALTSRLHLDELKQLSFLRNPLHSAAMNVFVVTDKKKKKRQIHKI